MSLFKTLTGAGATVVVHPLHRFKSPKNCNPKSQMNLNPKSQRFPSSRFIMYPRWHSIRRSPTTQSSARYQSFRFRSKRNRNLHKNLKSTHNRYKRFLKILWKQKTFTLINFLYLSCRRSGSPSQSGGLIMYCL